MAYALKYYMEYKDTHENLWRVELWQDGYIGGVVSEMTPSAAPFSTEVAAASTDKFSPIRVTTAVLQVEVDADYQYMDLYTQNDKEFKVVAKCNGAAYYTGFLVAEEYGEPYTAPGYTISLKSTDGFNSLKDVPFVYEAATVDSLYNMMMYCLNKLGLGLNVGCETGIYETQMSTSTSTNALKQLYIYATAFDNETTASNCYDVLAQILMAANVYIVQVESKFQIRSIDRITSQLTNDIGDTLPATLRLQTSTDVAFANNDMAIAVQRAWKRFLLKQEMTVSTNLVRNGNFNKYNKDPLYGYWASFKDWVASNNSSTFSVRDLIVSTEAILISTGGMITTTTNTRSPNIFDIEKEDRALVIDGDGGYAGGEYVISYPVTLDAMAANNRIIFSFEKKITSVYITEFATMYVQLFISPSPGVIKYYDFNETDETKVWSNTAKYLSLQNIGPDSDFVKIEKSLAPYTTSGFSLWIKLFPVDHLSPFGGMGSIAYNNVAITLLTNSNIAYPNKIQLATDITTNEGGEDLTVKLGDSPVLANALALYKNVFSIDSNRTVMSHNWKRRKGLSTDIHTALIADLLRDEMKLPAQQLTCTFDVSNPFALNGLRCITDAYTCGRHYMPMRLSYNTRASEMSCEYIEMVACAQAYAIWNDRVNNVLAPSVPAFADSKVHHADNCYAAMALLYEGRYDEAEAMVFYANISTFYNKAYFFTDGWHDDSEGSNTTSFFAAVHWLYAAAHVIKLFPMSWNIEVNKATVDTVVTALFATIQTSGTYNGLFTTTAEPVPYFEPHCLLVFAMKMLFDATAVAAYNTKYTALRDKVQTTFYRGTTPQEYYAYKADVNQPNAISLALGSVFAHKKNACTAASRTNMLNSSLWNLTANDNTAVEGIVIDTTTANTGKIDSVATLYTSLANGYYGYHAPYIKYVKNLGQLLNPSNRLSYSNVRSFAAFAQDEEGKTIRITSGQQQPTAMYSLVRRWYKRVFDFNF